MVNPPADRPGPVTTVTIAVPTYRRNEYLAGLIPALDRQRRDLEAFEGSDLSWRVEVLIVDNDASGAARPVVDASPVVNLRYVVEAEPGVAAVRNRALAESSSSRLLIFIDDDELPHDGWLRLLLSTWAQTEPAAVAGRVVSAFDGDLDPWVAAGDFFRRRSLPTGSPITVAATNNLLLDLDQLRALKLDFDLRFGLTGGEDTLLTRTLHRQGRRPVWCDGAVVTDRVPASRMTRSWVLARAHSSGNATVLVDLELAGSQQTAVRIRYLGVGVARTSVGAVRWLFGVFTQSAAHQAQGLRTHFRGRGMLAATAGRRFEEYARKAPGA